MKVGDLVEYRPSRQLGLRRIGVVVERWHMGEMTQYLCHWNVPSTATGKAEWWAPAQHIQPCVGGAR